MPLILAIEPDPRQAEHVAALSRLHLDADIVVVGTVEGALAQLRITRPDLVLTPPLLSAKDDAALTAGLRELGRDGVELQTLVIPMLATSDVAPVATEKTGGLLGRLRKHKVGPPSTDGCAPAVFAAQITEYLSRMALDRRDREESERADTWTAPRATTAAPMLGELWTPPTVVAPAVDSAVWPEKVAPPDAGAAPPPVVHGAALPGLDVEPLCDSTGPDEVPVNAEWQDLEPFLEDLEAEQGATALHAVSALDDEEPNVVEPPSPDELWAPLDSAHYRLIAPIEGPPMSGRPPAPSAKTPRSARAKTDDVQPARARRARRTAAEARPLQDEWGLYDPEQCGFAALLNRLEELTDADARAKEHERRSAIMRR